jgi:hypothetical protein
MERDYYLEAIKSTCYMPMQAQDPATLPYRESAPVPILQETGWAPQAVWRGTERRKSLAPTRVQNWTIQSIASNHRYSDKNIKIDFFYSCTIHLHVTKVFYLPTDVQENCFKKNIKIYIKTAPTCFSLITTIRERIIQACSRYHC